MGLDDQEVRERVGRVEALLEKIEALQDPQAQAIAVEAVQALLELYGEGLGRMMENVVRLGSEQIIDAFADDELISHLLLLHGLHPLDVKTRVLRALDEVRPYLASHGGDVELLSVEGGVARLRLQGSCQGCPSSSMTLKLAIEQSVQEAAPDLERIEADGMAEPDRQISFIPLDAIQVNTRRQPEEQPGWAVVGALPQLSGGGLLVKEISGQPILFLKLASDYYAYQHTCPNCGESLERASLHEAEITCAQCRHRYDARRAGRCLDAPNLHLEPVPLLVGQSGIAKVALSSAVQNSV